MKRLRYIHWLFSLFIVLGCLASCTTADYRYVAQSPDKKGRSEGYYPEPPEAPVGNVRLRALGLVDLRPKGTSQRIPALHLRMTVAKTSGAEPWLIKTSEQKLLFLNSGETAPLYSDSNMAPALEITISTGELRSLDLYFRLPNKTRAESNLPEFDLKWAVHSGVTTYANTTIFERTSAPNPEVYPYPYGYPYDPYPVGPVWYGGEMAAPIRLRN